VCGAVNRYNIAGFATGDLAAQPYFEAQALAPLSRHHALCDVRALRIAFDAANASSALAMALSHSAPPLSQKDVNANCASHPTSMAIAYRRPVKQAARVTASCVGARTR